MCLVRIMGEARINVDKGKKSILDKKENISRVTRSRVRATCK